MKKLIVLGLLIAALTSITKAVVNSVSDPNSDEIGRKTITYFNDLFTQLGQAAQKDPGYDNYREIMKPLAEATEGFFDGTLISPEWIIIQVYHPINSVARGYDLKKVKELAIFCNLMKEKPAPQLSEPGHGNFIQPRLIAMRYPVIKDGKVKNILSMMVRTKAYLKAVGLDQCHAYKIICLGKLAEEKGKLSADYTEVKLKLPSTEWTIQYQKQK